MLSSHSIHTRAVDKALTLAVTSAKGPKSPYRQATASLPVAKGCPACSERWALLLKEGEEEWLWGAACAGRLSCLTTADCFYPPKRALLSSRPPRNRAEAAAPAKAAATAAPAKAAAAATAAAPAATKAAPAAAAKP